jgi:peptide/nickel transport system substrate-binding protein
MGMAFAGGRRAASNQGNVLTIGLHTDIMALDPAFAYDPATIVVLDQIVERLVTFNDKGELVPHLAESWRAVDSTTYVYNVRKDLKFSDGTPVTMDDVLFSVQRTGDPASGALMGWNYDVVQSITKTGDWEITVKLKVPSASWPYVLATYSGIISKAYYEAHRSNFGTAAGGILGTGPYTYESWTSGQEIVLKKSPNYWDKTISAEMDTLVFKIITESTTLVAALQAGDVDFAPKPPQDMLAQLRSTPSLTVTDYPAWAVVSLGFNTQKAPLNDPNVRKAIYHAIDMKSLQTNIIKDAGAPTTILPQGESLYGMYPDEFRNFLSRAPSYEYSLTKAREYLAKSSTPNGFSFNLVSNNVSLRTAIAQVIQNALVPLNIKLEIVELTDEEHTGYQMGEFVDGNGIREYDSLLAGWWGTQDVASNMEPLLVSGRSTNFAAYKNSRVDDLLSRQSQLSDELERDRLIFQAMEIVADEVPYIYVMYPTMQVAMNNRFTGLLITSPATPITLHKVRKAN